MTDPTYFEPGALAPVRQRKAVVVADVVESVRLLSEHESETIARWRQAVQVLRDDLLPRWGGTLASHRGDGLVLVFEGVPGALEAMAALQRRLDDENALVDAGRRIWLRTAVHVCEVLVDEIDAFGAGVNIAARLATCADPGQTLLTVDATEELHPALDRAFEDLGNLYFKHLAEPVRASRLLPAPGTPEPGPSCDDQVLRPTLAIVPFAQHGGAPEGVAVSQLLADELICALSALPQLRVVSRLSAHRMAVRRAPAPQAASALAADYVVLGECHVMAGRVVVHAELHDARRDEVVDRWRGSAPLHSLVAESSPLVEELMAWLGPRLLEQQVELGRRSALPHLAGYSLLLAGVSLMHRLSTADVARSHTLLAHLCERWPRLAAPRAWLARWHLFHVIQGLSRDITGDRRLAFEHSARALELDPQSSVALAVAGSVRVGLMQDVDGALVHYSQALDSNPNDPFAWLLMGTAHAFKGAGGEATRATENAARLSPLDPMHFLYDCHAAGAALAADDSERALRLAERSLRSNSRHHSTLRVLAIAQMLQGRPAEAAATVGRLLWLDPRASVEGFLRTSPSAAYDIGRRFAELLAEAGLPRNAA